MKITEVKTFLMGVGNTPRNWLFVKVYTDEGITGVGESSGWPVVIKAAIDDISPMVIGEDPMNIEKIWQILYVGMMGHGMTGVVGSGAINGIEMALWDIKGKALGTPVWNLLGGKVRDSVRVYGHAFRYKMGIESRPGRRDGRRARARAQGKRLHGRQDRAGCRIGQGGRGGAERPLATIWTSWSSADLRPG